MSSIPFMLWLQSIEQPWLTTLMKAVTLIGSDKLYILFVAWLYWCKDTKLGEKWANLVLTSALLNSAVKLIVNAPRPFQVSTAVKPLAVETATGSSFPSGHSQASANFGTFLALNYKSSWVKALGIGLFVVVGFSRLYLRVHFPKDVLAGWLFGILLAIAFYYCYDTYKPIFTGLMFLSLCVGWYLGADKDLIKLTGLATSATLGFWLNQNYLKLEVHCFGSGGRRKLIIGVVALLLTLYGLKPFMPESFTVVRYFMAGLMMTVVYPLVFEWLYEKHKKERTLI